MRRLRMCLASVIRMNYCRIYWKYFILRWLTMGIVLTCGNPITHDVPESLNRNWHKEELNDLSGDGGLEESQISAKSYIETIVPAIYSSFSSPLPHHISSSIPHSSFAELLTKVTETASYSSEIESLLSIDYSIDTSTSEIEDCKMTHPSLSYSGPSSLLNTFIFRPSLDRPSPTPTWSSTESFTSSSGLREKSWWEIDEIPVISHEAHLSSPLPSSIDFKSSSCISSCDASIPPNSDITSTQHKFTSMTNTASIPLIVPTPSSSSKTEFSTADTFIPSPSSSSLKDASVVLSDVPSYFCSTYLVSSFGTSSSETTTLSTETLSVRTSRLPVFITDQFFTSGSVPIPITGSSNDIQSTYQGISSSSVLNIVSSTSGLSIIHSDSFDIPTIPTREFIDTVTHITTGSLDTMLSLSDFNPTWTRIFSGFSPSTFTSTRVDGHDEGSVFWTAERPFTTKEVTDMSIFTISTSSLSIYKPTEVITYESVTMPISVTTEYFRTTSYVTPEETYTKTDYSGMVSYDITTETSTKTTTRSPSTESSSLDDIRYWVKTIVKAEPNILKYPTDFLSIAKGRLARIYSLAFSRREQVSRQKRQTNDLSNVKIQFTKYIADWRNHQIELVYTIEYLEEPVLAVRAVDVLEEVESKEFSEMMGYMIIIKAEVYARKEEIAEKEQPWIIYAVIGTVGGFLLLIICIIALYFRYCHVKEEKLDTESVRLKMFGQQNRQQAFQEETQRSQQDVKDTMDVGRPLPQLPFQHLKKQKENSQRLKRTAKTSSEKRLLVSAETQTDGYYNLAYESDTTEASLTSVTSTQTSSDKCSQVELLKSPIRMGKTSKTPLKVPSKSKWSNSQVLSEAAGSERPNSAQFESAETSLLVRSRHQMMGNALSDTDAGTAEAEIEVGKMRRRITELLDDAFSYAGPKRMYSSLRSKPILPTSGTFHRWTSLRSPNRHELLNDSFTEAKSAESLPDVDPMKARHEPLFINLPPHKQPPSKPRVVWSIYKAGDEVSELSNEMQAKASQHEASGTSYIPPSKLFEHRIVPPPAVLLQPRPASPSSLIHPSFRPFSAPSIINVSDTLRPPYAMEIRPISHQPTTSSVPLLDTLQESPLSQHRLHHCERDEIDTATELKFRQPAQSVIEAIRDELQKFNTSLPNDNRESFA